MCWYQDNGVLVSVLMGNGVFIHTEMRDHHLYKNYSRGEPSMRLYIKNLGKQVVDQV